MVKKAVCLISGGLDSAVAASYAKNKGFELYFLFIDYGQKNLTKEKKSVRLIANDLHAKKLQIVKISYLKKFGRSALFDKNTTLDESNFLLEYVPFRNSQFLAIATAWAETIGATGIFVGSSGGDHICPDNSKAFLNAFQKVITIGTLINKNIKIYAPLANTDKTGAVKLGLKLGSIFKHTWSCHNNTNIACGHCSNCIARLKAFASLNKKDPIPYK